MAKAGNVSAWRKAVKGCVRSIRTVSGDRAVQLLKIERAALSEWALKTLLKEIPGAFDRSSAEKANQRLKLKHTASALNGVPSWKVTPLRSLNV
jgi:hypothetical protein